MKCSYNWLKSYVDLEGISPEECAERLTASGLEVEGIEKQASGSDLVIGKMLSCEKHPDSDHLMVCRVDDGTSVRQIVCGAPNAREAVGRKVIVALPGCELPGGTIRSSKIRGQLSDGMICALFELGVDRKLLTEKQLSGIEILGDDAPLGSRDVLSYLGLDDTILEITLTPNRADCLAMWSLAMQTGAVLNRKVTLPEEYRAEKELPATAEVSIQTDKCAWYLAKVIRHVQIGPSPEWIVRALRSNGIKTINNVVDISNLVMLETGQPLHFYDLKKIRDSSITVRQGLQETYEALDGQEYAIQPEDIMITNEGRTVGIAGIMGGEDSKIDETTDGILIEAASFDHVAIRNTSLRLNLQTEAAQRFIKMIEPSAGRKAVWRSTELLAEYAGAEGIEETVTAGSADLTPRKITLTQEKVNQVLGTSFTREEILEPLERLHFQPEADGDRITVTVPAYRMNDVALPEDVIEEIIQIRGYDNIIGTLPRMAQTIGTLEEENKLSRSVRDYLVGAGYHDILTYSLVGEKEAQDAVMPLGKPVAVLHPLSEERKYYRTSLLPSMLDAVSYNRSHFLEDFGLFEIGSVYAQGAEDHHARLSIALSGRLVQSEWKKKELPADFYTIKGVVEGLLEHLGYAHERISLEPVSDASLFHPFQAASVSLDGHVCAMMGKVHPAAARRYGLGNETVCAEMDLTEVMRRERGKMRFTPIPRFPSIRYDLSMMVDESVSARSVQKICEQNGTKLLQSAEIFDVYEGKGVAAGKKSLAVRMVFQAEDHTLKDEEIRPIVDRIADRLSREILAQIRAN